MDIFAFSQAEFLSFILTLIRVSLIVFLMPFFGGENAPATLKACICLVLTLSIWPHLSLSIENTSPHPLFLILLILGELILGLTLALTIHFIFAAIQTGGEIIGFQMGLSMLSFMDPMSGARVGVTSQILYMVTMVIFLSFDGHLLLIGALGESFFIVPPGGLFITEPLVSTIIRLSGDMFIVALKIAAPIMVALFMIELTLAIMGRAAPQMNLMTMGFPIKIAVGFFFLALLLGVMSGRVADLITEISPMLRNLMRMGMPPS